MFNISRTDRKKIFSGVGPASHFWLSTKWFKNCPFQLRWNLESCDSQFHRMESRVIVHVNEKNMCQPFLRCQPIISWHVILHNGPHGQTSPKRWQFCTTVLMGKLPPKEDDEVSGTFLLMLATMEGMNVLLLSKNLAFFKKINLFSFCATNFKFH